MTRLAAKKCFKSAGLNPAAVDVIELHDCFSANELITYEALGLCPEGHLFLERSKTHNTITFVRIYLSVLCLSDFC